MEVRSIRIEVLWASERIISDVWNAEYSICF